MEPATESAREPTPARIGPSPAPETQKARPVKLLESDSIEDAAVCVFSAALDHFQSNLPAFQSPKSAEAVHQMRVALRRLRAATGLFSKALSGPTLETARARAKRLGAVLGAVRNLDVFRDMVAQGPGDALSDDPGFPALLDALELRRADAYRAARDALRGTQVEVFIGEFRKAIASRDWEPAPGATEEGSAAAFAGKTLGRLRKRLVKKAKGLARRTPQERHAARIAAKKARYGAEFFESLFDRDEAAHFVATLADIQDGLGAFNDMAMAGRLLDDLETAAPASLRASGFVRGWFAHAAQASAAHARKTEKKLKSLARFWR